MLYYATYAKRLQDHIRLFYTYFLYNNNVIKYYVKIKKTFTVLMAVKVSFGLNYIILAIN